MKRVLTLLALLVLARGAHAAVTVDTANAVGAYQATGSSPQSTGSLTVSSADNALVVVFSGLTNGYVVPTSVTWNGTALTLVSSATVSASSYITAVYALLNPTPGTGVVTVTFPSAGYGDGYLVGIPLAGVNTASLSAAFGTPAWSTSSTSPVTAISSTATGAAASGIYLAFGALQTTSIADASGNMTNIIRSDNSTSFSVDDIPGADAGLASYTGSGGAKGLGFALSLPVFAPVGTSAAKMLLVQ